MGRKELLEIADHPIDFIIPQFGEHRQGDILIGIAFRFGKRKLGKAAIQPGLMVPRTQDPILPSQKILQLEDEFIPKELQRDYTKTFGHDRH